MDQHYERNGQGREGLVLRVARPQGMLEEGRDEEVQGETTGGAQFAEGRGEAVGEGVSSHGDHLITMQETCKRQSRCEPNRQQHFKRRHFCHHPRL